MAKIDKIIHSEKKIRDGKETLKVEVQLDDGMTGYCYVGGSVETFFVGQEIRVFVRKTAQPKVDNPLD